jgi:hypothetical protein
MSLPYARTYDEVYLYLGLRPCVCGETEIDERVSATVSVGGVLAERFSGECTNCGRFREFTFQMAENSPEISSDVCYGGDEPSRLLDPGEWLGVAELYTSVVDELLADGDLDDDDELTRTYFLLTSALAATDEVAKFIPAGDDAVAEGSFWSHAGRMVFEAAPQRFVRESIAETREALLQRLDDFGAKYGSSEE